MRHLFVLVVRDDERVDESMGDDPEIGPVNVSLPDIDHHAIVGNSYGFQQ
jgi:hypothetical protein